jgi:hypothetical protein
MEYTVFSTPPLPLPLSAKWANTAIIGTFQNLHFIGFFLYVFEVLSLPPDDTKFTQLIHNYIIICISLARHNSSVAVRDVYLDPGSVSKNLGILIQKIVSKLSEIWSGLFIPEPGPDFFYPSRIPDLGLKTAQIPVPDPDPQHCIIRPNFVQCS